MARGTAFGHADGQLGFFPAFRPVSGLSRPGCAAGSPTPPAAAVALVFCRKSLNLWTAGTRARSRHGIRWTDHRIQFAEGNDHETVGFERESIGIRAD